MKKYFRQSLPVLMHHSISGDSTQVSIMTSVFEEQCRMLAERGWAGVSLEEAEDFLINGSPLPEKSFLLTFDDGFLDNYVHAWPIMRKYGHKGVIFAVVDRITQAQRECARQHPEGQGTIRPTLEDVWQGRCAKEDLPGVDNPLYTNSLGNSARRDLFFTWDEARLMEQSKVMSIAAHSARHERVFAGPSYSDFVKPGDQSRTFCGTVPPAFWGMPGFAAVPELANRAFLPSPSLVKAITALVPQDEAAAGGFFSSPSRVDTLKALVDGHRSLGEYESPKEQSLRFRAIMESCQEVASRELGHKIRSFCWPWGAFCEEARKEGLAAGFEAFYTTRLGVNLPGEPLAVGRFKVKNRADSWLLRRLNVYRRPWLGFLYLKARL